MSTALVPVEAKETPVARVPVDYAGMLSVATQLVSSGFLPEHIKTPGQAVAIIMAGEELGMRPMLALRSLSMVKGKIVVAADAQLALFKSRGGRAWFEKLDETGAVLQLVHANGDKHTETFTIADARRAGLLGNNTWQKFPKAMLRSRCITAGLKSIGFEPTAGAYDPDEAAHFDGFTPSGDGGSAPISSAQPESFSIDETAPESQPTKLTLEQAKSLPLLGSPGSWGGKAGELLDTFSDAHLRSIRNWCAKKLEDNPDDQPKAQTVEAIDLILANRKEVKEVAERDQTKLELDPANEVRPASTSVPVPPAGKVADALESKEDPSSARALHKKVKKLLEHPTAISKEDREAYANDNVNGFKKHPLAWWVRSFENDVRAAEMAGQKRADAASGDSFPEALKESDDDLPF